MMRTYRTKTNEGYVTMFSVLIVGAVALTATISLILSGLNAGRTGLAYQQMYQAKALAAACAEEALDQIRTSTPYTGSGMLDFSLGNCLYAVTNLGGQSRLVEATGTVGTVVRKMRVTISSIDPRIVVSTWRDI